MNDYYPTLGSGMDDFEPPVYREHRPYHFWYNLSLGSGNEHPYERMCEMGPPIYIRERRPYLFRCLNSLCRKEEISDIDLTKIIMLMSDVGLVKDIHEETWESFRAKIIMFMRHIGLLERIDNRYYVLRRDWYGIVQCEQRQIDFYKNLRIRNLVIKHPLATFVWGYYCHNPLELLDEILEKAKEFKERRELIERNIKRQPIQLIKEIQSSYWKREIAKPRFAKPMIDSRGEILPNMVTKVINSSV